MKRPNILYILTDDQRFDTIGGLNCPDIDTPNFDRLVRSGTTFTHATIMGGTSGAICIPSRNMIMTGRTLFDICADPHHIPPEHVTFPEVLRRNGYSTHHIGKWHQDTASHARCFSGGSKLFMSGIEPHFYSVDFHWHLHLFDYRPDGGYKHGEWKCEDGPIEPFTPPYTRHKASGRHSSTVFTDGAINFLRSPASADPFCMYLAYVAPHDPRQYPTKYFEQYDAGQIPLPENFNSFHAFDNGDLYNRDEMLAGHPRLPWEIREHIKDYYAIISHLDYEIGRLLDVLEETGKADNTILVLAGDNGLAVGQHGLMGKQNLYEHSIRVPLIFRGPGIPEGRQVDAPCYLADVCPTLLEMADVPVPDSVTARSLAGVFGQGGAGVRPWPETYHGYLQWQRCLREDRFKLIEYNVKGKRTTQLFDLEADPKETRNLAGEPEFAGELVRMRKKILEARDAYRDHQPEYGKPFWEGYEVAAPGVG